MKRPKHILILNQWHLQLVLDEHRGYFNESRPHQGIDQRCPSSFEEPALGRRKSSAGARVVARPVLGGLHHTYQIAHERNVVTLDSRMSQSVTNRPDIRC